MKLSTVWTLRAMTLRERLHRTRDAAWRSVAYHLPRRLAYWSFIDSGVRTIRPDEIVPEVRYMDLLSRLDAGPATPDPEGTT